MQTERLSERTRWGVHLTILCCPIILGMILSDLGRPFKLPQTTSELVLFISLEFLMWGVVFAAAFRISGITTRQLCLVTSTPLRVICYGFLWFVVIRILSLLILIPGFMWTDPQSRWADREKVFSVMDANHIAQHPAFSFSVYGITALIAGFTEELWRVGMLRGWSGIFPQVRGTKLGNIAGIVVVSLIFGLGHVYEGWFGIANAVTLGFFLGLIIVYRRSYWESAIAHTLCDVLAFGFVTYLMLNPQAWNAEIVYNAYRGNISMVENLLKEGGNINASSGTRGTTALEAAAIQPKPEMVSFILERGANPNATDNYGGTPLILAAESNQLPNVKLLVAKGADLNLRDGRGYTALMAAVQKHYVEEVQFLIDNGADVNLADSYGITPLAAAQHLNYMDLVGVLQQHGGK